MNTYTIKGSKVINLFTKEVIAKIRRVGKGTPGYYISVNDPKPGYIGVDINRVKVMYHNTIEGIKEVIPGTEKILTDVEMEQEIIPAALALTGRFWELEQYENFTEFFKTCERNGWTF